MGKSRAALIHLWPSLLVLLIIAALILLAWYPYPLLQLKNNQHFSVLLILTAALIGPAMTWLMYKKGKRGMVFDLVVITLIQVVAIGWGTQALYLNRPYFMVFTVDRFEAISIREVDTDSIKDPRFLDKPFAGTVELYANMPKDNQLFQKLIREVMFEGKPDIQFRPEFWSLYSDRQELALDVSQPLQSLREARPESASAIDKLLAANGGDINKLLFVPGLINDGQFTVILNAETGAVVDLLGINPWLKQ